MPGHAARGGQPSPLKSHSPPSASEATSSRPSASAPGEKPAPALRIETKAEAHSTTVTAAAPAARPLSLMPVRLGAAHFDPWRKMDVELRAPPGPAGVHP
jgi:hypothetical protein